MNFITGRPSKDAANSCVWPWRRPARPTATSPGSRAEAPGWRRLHFLQGRTVQRPPFAPPFLRAGRFIVGQTANILQFLGPHHALVPGSHSGRLWIHELQLTIADLVAEVHR